MNLDQTLVRLPTAMRKNKTNSSHHGGSQKLATIFLTNQCNLSCPYCYAIENTFLPEDIWDASIIQPLLDILASKGYRISIGGGEPLTELALTLTIAREASRRRMGVSLLTNGYLLDEALLRQIRDAGIYWIQISADSIKEVEHFAPLLSKGTALGMRMAIGTVLMPDRVQEIKEMHQIIEASNAVGWRILRYTPLNNNSTVARAPTNTEWIKMLFTLEEYLRPLESSIQIRYEPSVVPLTWLNTQPDEKKLDICGGHKARRLFLYPNGEIFACGLPKRKGIYLGNFKSGRGEFKNLLNDAPKKNCWFPNFDIEKKAYCRELCRGGCLQMRQDQVCDPRCELDKGLVPVCCFEKLLFTPGTHARGEVIYPSVLFQNISGVN